MKQDAQKDNREIAKQYYMRHQEKLPPSFGAYVLPEEWEIDAMIDFSNDKHYVVSREIYNVSRRLRQLMNKMADGEDKEKLLTYITKLNELGTEIGGGVEVMIGKVLRS